MTGPVGVGIIGTAIGLVVGYSVAWTANAWQLIPLNPEFYSISYVPFHTSALDALWIAVLALGVSFAVRTLVEAAALAVGVALYTVNWPAVRERLLSSLPQPSTSS